MKEITSCIPEINISMNFFPIENVSSQGKGISFIKSQRTMPDAMVATTVLRIKKKLSGTNSMPVFLEKRMISKKALIMTAITYAKAVPTRVFDS